MSRYQQQFTSADKQASGFRAEVEELRQFIERIERLEEEKSEIGAQIQEVYSEAKNGGFEPKVMRLIVRLRKMDQHQIDEEEALLHLYKQALDMA
ncbi:MAG: DUF2312 domain-containing protein [Magnetococcales bacterium]|nr:DUF2312 domain-containing protein [Magnetococcales bacterium]